MVKLIDVERGRLESSASWIHRLPPSQLRYPTLNVSTAPFPTALFNVNVYLFQIRVIRVYLWPFVFGAHFFYSVFFYSVLQLETDQTRLPIMAMRSHIPT
jgi:hypothetical protein